MATVYADGRTEAELIESRANFARNSLRVLGGSLGMLLGSLLAEVSFQSLTTHQGNPIIDGVVGIAAAGVAIKSAFVFLRGVRTPLVSHPANLVRT